MKTPRPKGTTILSRYYQSNRDRESYIRIVHHIISHYTSNGFTYLGVPLSLDQLSVYTNIKPDTLQSEVLNVGNIYSTTFQAEDVASFQGRRANLLSLILTGLTADKATLDRLKSLVTNELQYENTGKIKLPHAHLLIKAIESSAKLQANFMSFMDTAFPQSQVTNILNITPNPDQKQYITQAEAAQIASSLAQQALNNPEILARLAEEYAIHDPDLVPEVRAMGAVDLDGASSGTSRKHLSGETDEAIILSIIDDFEAEEVRD